MVIVSQYRIENIRGTYFVRSEETNVCPVCNGTLKAAGSRKRRIICDDGQKMWTLIIRRLRCRACGVTHHELPDIIVPYKRHCVDTIEKIIGKGHTGVCCEESTIRRIRAWWEACRLHFENVIVPLREKYKAGFCKDKEPKLKEFIRAVVNANLWVHTRSAFLAT